MAGASYLFFLTVLLFLRGTIGVDDSIDFINLLENYGLSPQPNRAPQLESKGEIVIFAVGIHLQERSGDDTEQKVDVELYNPRYQSGTRVKVSFSCCDNGFHVSTSGKSDSPQIPLVDFPCKNVKGFIVKVRVSHLNLRTQIAYIVTLFETGGSVYKIPKMVGPPSSYAGEYPLTSISISVSGKGQFFFSDGIEFVNSPTGTSPTTFRTMFPLHTLKLQDESRTVIVRAFPELIDGGYAELQFQFYNYTTEKNVGKIFCLSVALNETELTIKESTTGETILVLDGTRPDGILVQLFFSPNPRYEMNAYKNGDCIKTYAGEINGVSNRIVLRNKNFDGGYEIVDNSTYKLPEFQNARATVQAFHNSGLTIEPDFARPIIFNGKFIFGVTVRRLPGMCCPFSFRLEFMRSLGEPNGRNLDFDLDRTSLVADFGDKNNPGLDMTGMNMDGFTVELEIKNKEFSYTVTPYSGGQSLNRSLVDVLELEEGPTSGYDRLTISMRNAENVYFDPKTEYVS